jgi:2-polyprenyl-6-methoxyphenol hydroxylase-like FAD-dependent oxidoreductase
MSAKSMLRAPSTGIDMLIVGGGIGGMTLAIESHRKGHNVRLIEQRENFDSIGMYISAFPNEFMSH